MNKHKTKELSIQISLSGLSFCILNKKSKSIEYLKRIAFEKKHTPFETLERLITALNTNTIFEQNFKNVLVIYENELSTFVPKPLFDVENSADYLKFNAKILNTDYIAHDEIPANDIINVFVPYININNYIFDRFGEFTYKHASTILIQSLLEKTKNSNEAILYVNVSKGHFETVAIEKEQLLFYNTFECHTKEDFIYFILFTVEQLQLNPETLIMKLFGDISEGDEFYEIVYKYIRYVELIEPKYDYKFEEKQQPNLPHGNYIILNSFN